jgi:hypothetical protein
VGTIKLRRYFDGHCKPLTLSSLTKVGVLRVSVQTGEESGWRRVVLGTLPVNPPLILSVMAIFRHLTTIALPGGGFNNFRIADDSLGTPARNLHEFD